MPSISLYPPAPSTGQSSTSTNPLPSILQTPSGLAIIEIQGTINAPSHNTEHDPDANEDAQQHGGVVQETAIGKLVFPDWSPNTTGTDQDDKARSKRVYLYVGKHQRMTGEVRELKNPMALIRRRTRDPGSMETDQTGSAADGGEDDLEIAEIVRYKILFASRPEPVGTEAVLV